MTTPSWEPGEPLWEPDPARAAASRLAAFTRWLGAERGVPAADLAGYPELHAWSVREPAAFWGALAEFCGVRFGAAPRQVLADPGMPGARWFPGATLNYAEHALGPGPGRGDGDPAVVFAREDGLRQRLTHGELRVQVAAARAGLRALGVGRGDRVAALLPNCPQALVAFLATASLGAIWSSCSPDFGATAVRDRFGQLDPVVLLAVDGYRYGGRPFEVGALVGALEQQLPSLKATVLVPYLDPAATRPGTVAWADLCRDPGDGLAFEQVPFDHPLWVLYSSGTTGLPKGIVHGHGGIVLEHLKMLALHSDLGPGDRFFWFTTTGWMMWNYLISGLLVGATVVAYDGSPGYPDLDALWRLAAEEGITWFGTSASFVQSCLKAGVRPAAGHDLSGLRALGSTGSPLSAEGFDWIAEQVGAGVQICSVSGGTDLCTAFVGAAPTVPVWRGEISCRCLGAAVEAFDEAGRPLLDQVGELVLTAPMPSMPVLLWNDPDGSRMRESYFDVYPGVWRHGDWIRVTPRGSCVIYGRSDATLNRGGVRMGTAEFYRVVERHPGVADSLVVDTTDGGGGLLCFLVLAPGAALDEVAAELRGTLRGELSPRHVPDRFVAVSAVPRTLNGKKCEVPVKRILTGTAPERAVSRDALANPQALDEVVAAAG